MTDLAFISLSILSFLLSFGYVAACERLMKLGARGDRLHDWVAGEHRHAGVPGAGDGEAGEVLT